MTVGSFKARYKTTCSGCGTYSNVGEKVWFIKGQTGYYCGEACLYAKHPEEIVRQTETTTTTTQAAQTTPEAARQSSIEQAHKDNMESARQTRDMIALLVTSVNSLQKELSVMVTVLREKVKEGKA